MATNDGDQGQGGRRKPDPITIDLTAAAVRLEPNAAPAPEAPTPSPQATPAEPNAEVAAAAPKTETETAKSVPTEPESPKAEPQSEAAAKPEAASKPEAEPKPEPVVAAAPQPTTAAPAPARKAPIAAALVGGAIGLAGAYGLAGAGLWPDKSAALTALITEQRMVIADLEKKLGQRLDTVSGSLDSQTARANSLATEIDHLKRLPEIPGVSVAEVAKALDPFTTRTTDALARMEELDKKLSSEQATLRSETKSIQDSVLTRIAGVESDVGTRLKAMEAANATTAENNAAVMSTMAKVLGDMATAEAEAKSFAEKTTTHFNAVDADLRTAAARLDARVAEAAAQKQAHDELVARIDKLDSRIAGDLTILRASTSDFAGETRAHLTGMQAAMQSTAKLLGDVNVLAGDTAKQTATSADTIARIQTRLLAIDDLNKALDGVAAHVAALEDLRKTITAPGLRLGGIDDARKAADSVAANLWLIDQRMTKVQAQLAEIETVKSAIDGTSKQLGTLDKRLVPLETKLAGIDNWTKEGVATRQQAVGAIALANLKSAVDTNRPFGAELATARGILRGIDLSGLEPYATKGVPTDVDLARSFPKVSRAIHDATQPAGEDTSVFGTLLSHATQSVKIRPAGQAEGDTVDARLARIEARLAAHDAVAALTEWQGLPEAGRKVSADWGAGLKARVDATTLLGTLTGDILSKLNSVSQ